MPVTAGSLAVTLCLLVLSGLFSGLTLGLLSLNLEDLDIIISGGAATEAAWARKVKMVRKRGNLLLCTLLLGNTLVNALIAIFSADMSSGLLGGVIATLVILVFGEIIPQAACSRHGLRIGAACVWIVIPLMVAFLPITWPISKCLDWVLGDEFRKPYNKRQLAKLLEMARCPPRARRRPPAARAHGPRGARAQHTEDKVITSDDRDLLASALDFSTKQAPAILGKGLDARAAHFRARGRSAQS